MDVIYDHPYTYTIFKISIFFQSDLRVGTCNVFPEILYHLHSIRSFADDLKRILPSRIPARLPIRCNLYA